MTKIVYFLSNYIMPIFYQNNQFIKYFLTIILCLLSGVSHAFISENLQHSVLDKDLQRLDNLDKANQLSYHYQQIQIGEKSYRLGVFEKQPVGKLRYLVVHDSENASFDSGLQSLIIHGGRMVVLENAERRGLFDFASHQESNTDPNRIFFHSLDDENTEPDLYLFSQYILSQLNLTSESLLIALHNNSPYSRFGLNHIDEFGDISVICQNDSEPKNLFWFTQTPSKNFDKNALLQRLCNHGFNVVVENVAEVSDNSLSNFAHFSGLDYVNIEIKMAKTGNQQSEIEARFLQQNYINALLQLINVEK